ncbi:MAG: hypothetical protein Q9169_005179 [Polycauliona sp. 2 TL-2023]
MSGRAPKLSPDVTTRGGSSDHKSQATALARLTFPLINTGDILNRYIHQSSSRQPSTMTSLPSISRRKHYRTVPGDPSEPTSTLVLTSPRGFYVDIRNFDPPQPSPDPKTFHGKLQWAFAGTKTSVQEEGKMISTWHHPIDSLTDDPKPDVGVMEELDNGDVLEKGEMMDEGTGVVVRYEELWEEVPLLDEIRDEGRRCVVLKTEEVEGAKGAGMAVRCGSFVQGVIKDGEGKVTVERWEWVHGVGEGRYERTVRLGEGELPCEGLVNGGLAEMGEGERVDVGGVGWVVVEVSFFSVATMANIKYIPPQMGSVEKYTERALRTSPMWLLVKDAGVLLTVLPYLHLLFVPMSNKSKTEQPQSVSKLKSVGNTVTQIVLGLLELVLLILFIPAFVALPGLIFLGVALICVSVIRLIAWPAQGPRILYSTDPPSTSPATNHHPHERWVFINGIGTGSTGLQTNIDRLSHLFGRQVLGIHNESYGIFADIFEGILQRCLSFKTMDVRVACEIVKAFLMDEQVERLVLVGHSQGGIVVSMVVDAMLMELPADVLGKMEIYTFGSAASHFHNPPIRSLDVTSSSSRSMQTTTIPYIEHYANEYDMVPRWGVLYAISKLLNNRCAGNVFIRDKATGHMFIDHYLNPIFPTKTCADSQAMPKPPQANGNGYANKHSAETTHENQNLEKGLNFLDAVVEVDEAIPLQRRNIAPLKPLAKMKNGKDYGNVRIERHSIVDGFDAVGNEQLMEQAARGKTVKDLSRLWRYLNGSSPEERQEQSVQDRVFGRAIAAGRRGT